MGEGKHTPGPWAWMGSPHGLYLATTHSGRRYVMGFRRMGFNHAQPVFIENDRMVPATDLVEFEVGDRTVRGFDNAKANDSVYRYDVSGIDNADARLIAAAPDSFGLVVDFIEWVDRFTGSLPEAQSNAMFDLYTRARRIHMTVDKDGHDASRQAAIHRATAPMQEGE